MRLIGFRTFPQAPAHRGSQAGQGLVPRLERIEGFLSPVSRGHIPSLCFWLHVDSILFMPLRFSVCGESWLSRIPRYSHLQRPSRLWELVAAWIMCLSYESPAVARRHGGLCHACLGVLPKRACPFGRSDPLPCSRCNEGGAHIATGASPGPR